MTEIQQKTFQDFLRWDHLLASITDFMKSVQDMGTTPLKEADRVTLIAQWSKYPRREVPTAKIVENLALLSSSADSWTKIGQTGIKDFQKIAQLLILRIPDQFRSREARYIHRMEQKDYPFFISEVKNLLADDLQLAYKTADLLEKAMNIGKINESDPLESRKIEDFQWSLIEAKRILQELQLGPEEDIKGKKAKLEKIVHDLEDKMLACEKTKRALRELGLEEIMKELTAEKLPNGRVQLIWKKSG